MQFATAKFLLCDEMIAIGTIVPDISTFRQRNGSNMNVIIFEIVIFKIRSF